MYPFFISFSFIFCKKSWTHMCVTRHKSKHFYCSAMDAHVRHVHKIPEEVKFYILTHFSIKINLFWSIIYSKITMALANTTKYLAAVNVILFVCDYLLKRYNLSDRSACSINNFFFHIRRTNSAESRRARCQHIQLPNRKPATCHSKDLASFDPILIS